MIFWQRKPKDVLRRNNVGFPVTNSPLTDVELSSDVAEVILFLRTSASAASVNIRVVFCYNSLFNTGREKKNSTRFYKELCPKQQTPIGCTYKEASTL